MIKKKQNFIVIGAAVLSLSTFCSCMNARGKNSLDSQSISDYTEDSIETENTSVSNTTSTTTAISTEDTNYTSSPSEIKDSRNPLLDTGIDYDTYKWLAINTILTDKNTFCVRYGFNNSYAINMLKQNIVNNGGSYDESLSLADVNYFQEIEDVQSLFTGQKFSSEGLLDSSFRLELLRAVLSSEGLCFGTDEIPASYFERRFPGFTYGDLYLGSLYNIMPDGSFDVNDGNKYRDYSNPNDINDSFWLDRFIFEACVLYNRCLVTYVYNSPYGKENNIRLELDSETGKNILKPSEKQMNQLLEDIHSLKGCENIDITRPETREEFIAAYGIDPIDLVGDSRAFSLNTKEGFEQYLQENGLEAPKTVSVSYEDVNFSFDLPPSRGKSS